MHTDGPSISDAVAPGRAAQVFGYRLTLREGLSNYPMQCVAAFFIYLFYVYLVVTAAAALSAELSLALVNAGLAMVGGTVLVAAQAPWHYIYPLPPRRDAIVLEVSGGFLRVRAGYDVKRDVPVEQVSVSHADGGSWLRFVGGPGVFVPDRVASLPVLAEMFKG